MDALQLRSAAEQMKRRVSELIRIAEGGATEHWVHELREMRIGLTNILRDRRLTEEKIAAHVAYLKGVEYDLWANDSEEGLHWLKARFFSGAPKASDCENLIFFSEPFSGNLVPCDRNTWWLGGHTARLSHSLRSQSYTATLDFAKPLQYPDFVPPGEDPIQRVTFHLLPPDNPSRSNQPVLVVDLRRVAGTDGSGFRTSSENVGAFANEFTIRAHAVGGEYPPFKVSFMANHPESFFDLATMTKKPRITLSDDHPSIKRYNLQQITDFARSRTEALTQKIDLDSSDGSVLRDCASLIRTVRRGELPSFTEIWGIHRDCLPQNLLYTVAY